MTELTNARSSASGRNRDRAGRFTEIAAKNAFLRLVCSQMIVRGAPLPNDFL